MLKLLIIILLYFASAGMAYGQASLPTADPIGAGAPGGITASGSSASQSCDQAQCQDDEGLCIPNPLTECTIQGLLNVIIDWLIIFSFLIATGMIVWAGVMYVTAAGNTEQVKDAQRIIIYTLIGLVVVILSKSVALIIQNFFK